MIFHLAMCDRYITLTSLSEIFGSIDGTFYCYLMFTGFVHRFVTNVGTDNEYAVSNVGCLA